MAEDEVCLLEADEALGFFAKINEAIRNLPFVRETSGMKSDIWRRSFSDTRCSKIWLSLRHNSAAREKQFLISSYRFLSVKRVHPLGSCHVSEPICAIGKPFRLDTDAIQHRQQ